MLCTN